MTVLNRGQIAAGAAAGTESGTRQFAPSCSRLSSRRHWISLLAGLLIAVGAGQLATPANARGMHGGSIGNETPADHASLSFGRSTMEFNGAHAPRFAFRRDGGFAREDFDRFRGLRRFHHRHRNESAEGFVPFGFFGDWGWPIAQTDLLAGDEGSEAADERGPPFRKPLGRYEPPTVETTPSGVTIIRGPGSRH